MDLSGIIVSAGFGGMVTYFITRFTFRKKYKTEWLNDLKNDGSKYISAKSNLFTLAKAYHKGNYVTGNKNKDNENIVALLQIIDEYQVKLTMLLSTKNKKQERLLWLMVDSQKAFEKKDYDDGYEIMNEIKILLNEILDDDYKRLGIKKY